ncbi:MAG: hypothetical protein J0M03_24335 [Acidobacteria bacterium]|nr:hypothetical protein [Acidobacteriota bacterium]MBN8726046.1 hypothetical protein [Acidobacteriota bacterium]
MKCPTKYLLMLLLIVGLSLYPMNVTKTLAHGGEDHSEENSSLPTPTSGQVNIKIAKTSSLEALVKYPTPKFNQQTPIKIFLTDLVTNAPIENTQVNLVIEYLGPGEVSSNFTSFGTVYASSSTTQQITATQTATSGIYQANVVFPSFGFYRILMKFNGNNLNAQAVISGIFIPSSEVQNIDNKKLNSGLVGIIIAIISLLVLVLIYLFSIPSTPLKSKVREARKEAL